MTKLVFGPLNIPRMDHYFANKHLEYEFQRSPTFGHENDLNDNSSGSSNHTFIIDHSQNNTSGLWDYEYANNDWYDNGSNIDGSASRDRIVSKSADISNADYLDMPSNRLSYLISQHKGLPHSGDVSVPSHRPNGLDLLATYQPVPSSSEPRLSRSFNESLNKSFDGDNQEEVRKREEYRRKVETHYKKLLDNKVITPESEILNQSWSSVEGRTLSQDGAGSPSYKIGVTESDWREIDHHRSLSMERDRSNSSLAMYADQSSPNSGSSRPEERGEDFSESSPEHTATIQKKRKVKVRRHDSLIKYGSEPNLAGRLRPAAMSEVSHSHDTYLSHDTYPSNSLHAQQPSISDHHIDQRENPAGENNGHVEQDDFYEREEDYYKTLPRSRGLSEQPPKHHNMPSTNETAYLSRPRSTPNISSSPKHQLYMHQSSDSESSHLYPWTYTRRPHSDDFYVHFNRRDPSESSERSSRLDPQTYQSYVAGILHSSGRSEKFLTLAQRYAMLERIAEIEEGTLASNEILGRRQFNVIDPKMKERAKSMGNLTETDANIDYLLLSKYKLENLKELKELYEELQYAQANNEFFFDTNRTGEFQWSPYDDIGLAIKETTINDLYEIYEKGKNNFNTKSFRNRHKRAKSADFRRELSFKKLAEKYKHLDETSRKEKMMEEFWKIKLFGSRRGSQSSLCSGSSVMTQGSYIQIMENMKKKAKERPIFGYFINERQNNYEKHIQKNKAEIKAQPQKTAEIKIQETKPQQIQKEEPARKSYSQVLHSRPRNSESTSPQSVDSRLSRERHVPNGSLRPHSGRSSESGYDSVDRDLQKLADLGEENILGSKELQELWDILDGKSSSKASIKYDSILKNDRSMGQNQDITVAYGSFERNPIRSSLGPGRNTHSAAARNNSPKPVVSCFGGGVKANPEKDYPNGIPGNIKRFQSRPSSGKKQHIPGEPWRSEVRGVVGVEASSRLSSKSDPNLAKSVRESADRTLAQGSEFDRYLGNDAIGSSQKRYENFRVSRSWRKDSKPQKGAVNAALSMLGQEILEEPIVKRTNTNTVNSQPPSHYERVSDRDPPGHYGQGRQSRSMMRKSHTFDTTRGRNRNDMLDGAVISETELKKYKELSHYSDRHKHAFDSRNMRNHDEPDGGLDMKKLAAAGMTKRDVNPVAYRSAKNKFESTNEEPKVYPQTALGYESSRTSLGRYEAKIRSRSHSPSRRSKSAGPETARQKYEYKYEPYKGAALESTKYSSLAKSSPSLNKTNYSDRSPSGGTYNYNPVTGRLSEDTASSDAMKKPYGQYTGGTLTRKYGSDYPSRLTGGSIQFSYNDRKPDGESSSSVRSSLGKSVDRAEHHMHVEDSQKSHKSLQPVRINLLNAAGKDSTDSTVTTARATPMSYHPDYLHKPGTGVKSEPHTFNRAAAPYTPQTKYGYRSQSAERPFSSYSTRPEDYPNLSEFREEIKREVTGKEKSPPGSDTQDKAPPKPYRSWSTANLESQGVAKTPNESGLSKWSDLNSTIQGVNQNHTYEIDDSPEPGRLQKWRPDTNLTQAGGSIGGSADTLIIKGSDPDLAGDHEVQFQSVRQMKNKLIQNLEKAKSEPDMLGAVSKSHDPQEEEESTRLANFDEIRAKYESGTVPINVQPFSRANQMRRTVSGELSYRANKPPHSLENNMIKRNTTTVQSAPPPKLPEKKYFPPVIEKVRLNTAAPVSASKNYNANASPVVEQVKKLISDGEITHYERRSTNEPPLPPRDFRLWDVTRDPSPPAHEVSAKLFDSLDTIGNEWEKEKNKNAYSREIVMRPEVQSSPTPSSSHSQPSSTYQPEPPSRFSSSTLPINRQTYRHEMHAPVPTIQISSYQSPSRQYEYGQSSQQYSQPQQQYGQQYDDDEPTYSTVDRRMKHKHRQQQQQQTYQPQSYQQPSQHQHGPSSQHDQHHHAHGYPESRSSPMFHPHYSQRDGRIQDYDSHWEPDTRYERGPDSRCDSTPQVEQMGMDDRYYGVQMRTHHSNAYALPRPKSAMAGLVKYTDPTYHVYTAQSHRVNAGYYSISFL